MSGVHGSALLLLRCVAGLLAAAILVQFFFAGMAALTKPGWWAFHLTWVEFFQWLVVPLPVLAWFAEPPRRIRILMACIPIAQIALQYVLVHRALEGRLPIGIGLHAVNAALMLLVVTALVVDWPNSGNLSSERS